MKVLGMGAGVGSPTRTKKGYGPPRRYYGKSLPSKPNGSFPALDQDLVAARSSPYQPLEQPQTTKPGMAGTVAAGASSSTSSRNWKQQVSKLNCIVCVAGGIPASAAVHEIAAAGAAEESATSRDPDGDDAFFFNNSNINSNRKGVHEEDEDAHTLDHTYDETATSTGAEESHGGWHSPAPPLSHDRRGGGGGGPMEEEDDDPYYFDVVEQDPAGWRGGGGVTNGGAHHSKSRSKSPPRRRTTNRHDPSSPHPVSSFRNGGRSGGGRMEDKAVVNSAAAAVMVLSADSSSHYLSETRTSDSSGLPLDTASFSTTTSDSSMAENAATKGSSKRRARPIPPRHRRRQRRLERQRRKKAAAEAAAKGPAEEDDEEEEKKEVDEDEINERVGIRPFVVPEEVRQRMLQSNDGASPRDGLDQEYSYFFPTSESNIELPPVAADDNDDGQGGAEPPNEDDSLAIYDEDLYYQRAQEILHAAIVASAQSSPERSTTKSKAAFEPATNGAQPQSPAPPDKPSAATSPNDDPFSLRVPPPLDQDDEEPALDETGGTYDDDDTIATEEAVEHVPTPCPSQDQVVGTEALQASRGRDTLAPAPGTIDATGSSPKDALPLPTQRHRLQAMVRSPSQGDSPVARSSRMASQFNLQAATPTEIDRIRPENLSSTTTEAAAHPKSVQEALQKLESLNEQLRANKAAFESPGRGRSLAAKSFDRDSPLRASKSFPEDSLKANDEIGKDWDDDPFEVRKSPSSPPSFSDTEIEPRKPEKEENEPPRLTHKLAKSVPPAPPPSPAMNTRKIPVFIPPPPPTPPPPNTPSGPSPANSVPSSPSNSTASSKLKTLISKFESTPTRPSTLGPRKVHQRPPASMSASPVEAPLSNAIVTARKPVQLSTDATKSTTWKRATSEAALPSEAISRPPPSLVASTRLKYSQAPVPQSLPPPSPRAPVNTAESSPKPYGASVRKVPSARRGHPGSPSHPSPRGSLVKQHPTWKRFPPNASPPSESSRQPIQTTSRGTPIRADTSQMMHLTPPVLTQQRRANRPIATSKTPPPPASSFFWRSHPSSGDPELSQQPSLESLADVLTNSTNDDTATSPLDKGKGSGDGAHHRLGDYEQMLEAKRQEARRKFEAANKPPWAKKAR